MDTRQRFAFGSFGLVALLVGASALAQPRAPEPESRAAEIAVRAAVGPSREVVRLELASGTAKAAARVAIGDGDPSELFAGEAAGTLKTAHGRTVIALAVDDAKAPFRVISLVGGKLGTPVAIGRPAKRHDVPLAVVIAPTPDGFTVLFQEVEAANANEAHTYMLELDRAGAPTGTPLEIEVPWWIADLVWNGGGYHLALFYAADMAGMRLSMVSLDRSGRPQQHPDWASAPGLIADVHLVARGRKIAALYRGGAGDRLLETDVTEIGQWGQVAARAKDRGALAASMVIAIGDNGAATKVKAKVRANPGR